MTTNLSEMTCVLNGDGKTHKAADNGQNDKDTLKCVPTPAKTSGTDQTDEAVIWTRLDSSWKCLKTSPLKHVCEYRHNSENTAV